MTPTGEIVAVEQRGTLMGNRGCIHREAGVIARPWQVRRWIACALSYKDWVAPRWAPGRWTALFFWDEAVALAAGHRPCALCRRADYRAWQDAWQSAFGERLGADAMDVRLHADRVDADRRQRRHTRPWVDLPAGTFVLADDGPALVIDDALHPWTPTPAGYGPARLRPGRGEATVLTPVTTVELLRHGYRPAFHPSLSG